MADPFQEPAIQTVAPNERLRRPRRISGAVLACLGLIAFNLILALQAKSSSAADGGMGTLDKVGLFVVFAIPCAWFAWRISRSGLWIGSDALVIRGPLRSWTIQPSNAVRFVPGIQRGLGNGTPCPILECADGREVGIWALGRDGLVWNFDDYLDEMKPLCNRLNRCLERQYPQHPLPVFERPTAI